MNLEEQINQIIEEYDIPHVCYLPPMEEWNLQIKGGSTTYSASDDGVRKIDRLIETASLAECLTSKYEYIREYRKLYESRKR